MDKEKELVPRFRGFTLGASPSTTTTSSTTSSSTVTATSTSSIPSFPLFGKAAEVTNPTPLVFKPDSFSFLERESPWRKVEWTEDQKKSLMRAVSAYRPRTEEHAAQARVLLLGPVGSGKSSFISSVQSVFTGRVTNRAMVGSYSDSFTKKLQSYSIRGQKGDQTGLVLCDGMGLGDGLVTGLTLHDVLSVIKGHVPEGHKFSPDQPVNSETEGFVKKPSLKDKIHCVAFVVDASKIAADSENLRSAFRQLRRHISDLGVHQVALLTHVDKICPKTAKDVSCVYTSRDVRQLIDSAAVVLGMSASYIVPVKNYSSELEVDVNADVLLLSAVDHILQYVDLYFQDNASQSIEL